MNTKELRYHIAMNTATSAPFLRKYAVIDNRQKGLDGQPLAVYQTNNKESAESYCEQANRFDKSLS